MLNQLTVQGTTSVGYDGRGNVTSIGATPYSYNGKNQLVARNGGTQLYYEPLGRLTQQWNGGGQCSKTAYPARSEWCAA